MPCDATNSSNDNVFVVLLLLDVGGVKIDVKNQISSDLGINFNGNCSSADGQDTKVASSLETKYDLSSYGLQSSVKWTTDNELLSEITLSDSSILNGLKLAFITKCALTESKKAGTVKASMEGSNYNMTGNLEFEGEAPKLNTSGVYK